MTYPWDETEVEVTIVVTRRYGCSSNETIKDDIDAMIGLMKDGISYEEFSLTSMNTRQRMNACGESND